MQHLGIALCVLSYINQSKWFNLIEIHQMSQSFYTVERIIGKRTRKGMDEYKVKWLGYSEDDCTWQPIKNLQNVEDLIMEFEGSTGEEKKTKNSPKPAYFQEQSHDEEIEEKAEEDAHEEDSGGNMEEDDEIKHKSQYYTESQEQNLQAPKNQKGAREDFNQNANKIDENLQIDSLFFEEGETDNRSQDFKPSTTKKQRRQLSKKEQLNQRTGQKSKHFQQKAQKQPKKSYLQQIQQKTRFVVKAPPKTINSKLIQSLKSQKLIVLQISRCNKTNEFIYLTQQGPLISYRRQADMKQFYPDELIKFYESRIEFAHIPRINR